MNSLKPLLPLDLLGSLKSSIDILLGYDITRLGSSLDIKERKYCFAISLLRTFSFSSTTCLGLSYPK